MRFESLTKECKEEERGVPLDASPQTVDKLQSTVKFFIAGEIFVRDQIWGVAGRRDQPQYRVQVLLRAGFDGQGAGHDDQPEPSLAFPEQQHRRAELRRDSAAILLRGQNSQEASETNKTRWTGARRL